MSQPQAVRFECFRGEATGRLALLVGLVLAVMPLSAQAGSSQIFADGFEAGTSCLWVGPCLDCVVTPCKGPNCPVLEPGTCLIDDQFCVDEGPSPTSCLLCEPLTDPYGWTFDKGATCDDGDVCTEGDFCDVDSCAGEPVVCEVTGQTCEPLFGGCICPSGQSVCEQTCVDTQTNPNYCGNCATVCNDGLACTVDSCQGGECFTSIMAGSCLIDGVCYGAGDQGGTVCGVCDPSQDQSGWTARLGTDVICDDGNFCTAASCDPISGGCTNGPKPDGTPCNSGDPCTVDVCQAGNCAPSGPVDCNDLNPCTSDSCQPFVGCQNSNLPDATVCDDSDACTAGDGCTQGICEGVAISCNDGNVCTIDSCNAVIGCEWDPISCDDSNPCTIDSCNPVIGCMHQVDCLTDPPGGQVTTAPKQTRLPMVKSPVACLPTSRRYPSCVENVPSPGPRGAAGTVSATWLFSP